MESSSDEKDSTTSNSDELKIERFNRSERCIFRDDARGERSNSKNDEEKDER